MANRSLIDFLNLADPSVVPDLVRRFPKSKELFSPAMTLGEEPQVPGSREAKLTLAAEGIQRLAPTLEAIANTLRERLQLVRRLRLAGGVVAAAAGVVGASLVLASKALNWPKDAVTLGMSIFSMMGGMCTVLAGHWETSPTGKRIDALEELGEITELKILLERARARLRNDKVLPLKDADLDALIQELDEASVRAIRLAY